jgi:inner membrane protein
VDNLCHTLVGAALAKSGLEKRTALATATLVIGANLPDIDVFSYVWGAETALGFRRGWTHGVLALVVWPFLLTGVMMAWDRSVRWRRPRAEPVRPGPLLLLAALAILTHPALDWLNTYGMRWLMPFRDAWSYGDVLFIMDPWIWLALGTGWWWSRCRSRRGSRGAERPARAALVLVSIYILVLWGSRRTAVELARDSLVERGVAVGRLMAGPYPVNPFRRQIVAEAGDRYALAIVDWLRRPRFEPGAPAFVAKIDWRHRPAPRAFVRRNEDPHIRAAVAATYEGRIFLHWARFPFYRVEPAKEGRLRISVMDARYTLNPGTGFGRMTVMVPANPHPPGPLPPPPFPPYQERGNRTPKSRSGR